MLDAAALPAALRLSRQADSTLTDQLAARFAERIRQRLLAPGARLPSVRECARRHEVSPTTVVAAYDQLLAQGLVEARAQRGFYVRGPLAEAAPEPGRSGPVEPEVFAQIVRSLRIPADAIRASNWVDNGPGWVAVMLGSRDEVLALQPDFAAMRGLELGVVAPWSGGEAQFEVRAFVPSLGVPEDPVTGSLNAGLAQWLIGAGLAPERYVASQGTALGRSGRVFVEKRSDTVWIGGDSVVVVSGQVSL